MDQEAGSCRTFHVKRDDSAMTSDEVAAERQNNGAISMAHWEGTVLPGQQGSSARPIRGPTGAVHPDPNVAVELAAFELFSKCVSRAIPIPSPTV